MPLCLAQNVMEQNRSSSGRLCGLILFSTHFAPHEGSIPSLLGFPQSSTFCSIPSLISLLPLSSFFSLPCSPFLSLFFFSPVPFPDDPQISLLWYFLSCLLLLMSFEKIDIPVKVQSNVISHLVVFRQVLPRLRS